MLRKLDYGLLSVTPNTFSETTGANAATGTVTRNTPTTSALTVNLSSGNPGEAMPATPTVTIPAGATSATFQVNAVDDTEVDGSQSIILTASASGFQAGTDNLTVTDDESKLTLSITPGSFSEATGASAATGTVTRNTDTTAALTVNLSSGDASEAVPAVASVTILAGQSSATFQINAVDDAVVDGSQSIVLIASATGFPSAVDTVTVTDDDTPELTLLVSPNQFNEGAGSNAATGTVTRNTDTTAALSVTLSSNDPGEATVPISVMIPAGAASKTFAVQAVNDTVADGPQSVVLSASASGHTTGTAVITVTDNERAASSASATTVRQVHRKSKTMVRKSNDRTTVASKSATLTFNPDQTAKSFTVAVNGETLAEPDEMFQVNLSGAVNATIFDSQGVGIIITNDDSVALALVLVSPKPSSVTLSGAAMESSSGSMQLLANGSLFVIPTQQSPTGAAGGNNSLAKPSDS